MALVTGLVGCGGAKGNDPGDAYMPDMYYSRAYETYDYNNVEGERDSLRARKINYNGMPVMGTIARGEAGMLFQFTADSAGLLAAERTPNPLDSAAMTKPMLKEAERLYLINCGICHGTALDGNGPIVANGAYPAVPANLVNEKAKTEWTDGHYYHVITHGKGVMGAYSSQLTPIQRWWVVKYIRSKQGGGKPSTGATATADSSAAPAPNQMSGGNPILQQSGVQPKQ
jgi:mono/diheme cytochrome c family protein